MKEQAELRQSIKGIVLGSIEEVTAQGLSRIQVELGEAANILAGGGFIDSLGLTSLFVTIEQDIEEELGFTIDLTSKIAPATGGNTNPLATVGTLTDYILNCLVDTTVCGGV